MTRPVVLAVLNHKGGVGKTTTAINLASAFAASGKKTLLVDLDPQGNAGTGLGIDRATVQGGTAELLRGEKGAEELAVETKVAGLKLIASSIELATEDVRLGTGGAPEVRLGEALAKAEHFQVAVVDCPPSFGILSLNALAAADKVLIPVQSESFALEGLTQIVATIRKVKARSNPDLRHGIVLTMLDEAQELSQLVAREVRAHFGARVFHTTVPREEKVSEAAFRGLPVLILDPLCSGAVAYLRLAGETLYRLGLGGAVMEENDANLEPAIKAFAAEAGKALAHQAVGLKEERSYEALAARAAESEPAPETPSGWGRQEPVEPTVDPAFFEGTPQLVSVRMLLFLAAIGLTAVAGLVTVALEWRVL